MFLDIRVPTYVISVEMFKSGHYEFIFYVKMYFKTCLNYIIAKPNSHLDFQYTDTWIYCKYIILQLIAPFDYTEWRRDKFEGMSVREFSAAAMKECVPE